LLCELEASLPMQPWMAAASAPPLQGSAKARTPRDGSHRPARL